MLRSTIVDISVLVSVFLFPDSILGRVVGLAEEGAYALHFSPIILFEYFLTDRVANYSYAVRYVEEELREAQSYPIILIAVEHDGFSNEAIPKKVTNISGTS